MCCAHDIGSVQGPSSTLRHLHVPVRVCHACAPGAFTGGFTAGFRVWGDVVCVLCTVSDAGTGLGGSARREGQQGPASSRDCIDSS